MVMVDAEVKFPTGFPTSYSSGEDINGKIVPYLAGKAETFTKYK